MGLAYGPSFQKENDSVPPPWQSAPEDTVYSLHQTSTPNPHLPLWKPALK